MGTHQEDSWSGLNKRQQKYLTVIYETDQEVERWEKDRAAREWRSRPADEWRWMKYGIDEFGYDTPLKERLRIAKLIDQGTGSTFDALEGRGYILVRHEPAPLSDPIPFIRMTTKGRKLVRTAAKEKRPARLPAGTLKEWHWKALVKAYQSHLLGEVGVRSEYGGSDYGNIGWVSWVRLRNYKRDGKYMQLIREHEIRDNSSWRGNEYVLQITETGIRFYETEWERYVQLYPTIIAPRPVTVSQSQFAELGHSAALPNQG